MVSSCTPNIVESNEINSSNFDCLVLVLEKHDQLASAFEILNDTLVCCSKIHSKFSSDVHTLYCDKLVYHRLVLSFTGPLDRDIDDSRRITEAASKGLSTAIKLGATKPLLALAPITSKAVFTCDWLKPPGICLAALFGALQSLYVPLEAREFAISGKRKTLKPIKAPILAWFNCTYSLDHSKLVYLARCIEEGRRVARDIGGSDPRRMTPNNIFKYIKDELDGITIDSSYVDERYPTAAAVDRGSSEEHKGLIVHLTYIGGEDKPDVPSLFLIGKGITYDTGGSDLKVGGNMAGMHRDKCGAAAVVGFFKVLNCLKPKNIRVFGSIALVRNSIGNDAYVSDEIVISRAGMRIRVNNTDAEGRMVMTDLLCEAKERALKTKNPRIVSIATLTGHAILSYGTEYTAIVCNEPARRIKEDVNYQASGAMVGEMFEISTLRREDYDAHKVDDEAADLINAGRSNGGKRYRGHQSPVAFMILASGLDAHLSNSEQPLPYTHFDIAGSNGPFPGIPTAVPILTLANRYLLTEAME